MKSDALEQHKQLQIRLNQLQNENELNKCILNSIYDLQIFSVDTNYCYTAFNDSYQEEVRSTWGVGIKLGESCLTHLKIPAISDEFRNSLNQAYRGESFSRILHQPLTESYYELAFKPLSSNDKITGAIVVVKNISKQKHSDQNLQHLSNLLDEAQETSKTGNWEWNLLNNTIWWSDQLYRIFDVTRETFTATQLNKISFIHPDDQSALNNELEKLISSKGRMEMDIRIISGIGAQKYCSTKAKVECDEDGNIIRIYGTVTDLTERILAEEKLRESDEKFRKLYEEGPFGMGMAGPDLKFIMANKNFCDMVGYTEAELMTRSFEEISDSADFLKDLPEIKKLISGEIPLYKTEKRYRGKNGQEIWGSLTVTAYFDKKGNFLYNVAIIEDITRRKIVEAELKRTSERLELATQASKIGIWDWDIQKNELVWDQQMYSLYGIEASILPTAYEAWLNGLHPDDRESSDRKSQQAVWERQEYDTEFRVLWPNESVHWLKSIGQVFYDDDGTPVRMVGVNYDISDRKQYEAAIIENRQKLETALESIADAVVISDVKGNFVDFNEAFASFHKFSRKEECAKTLTEYPDLLEVRFSTGELAPLNQWAIPRALRGEIAKNEEYILKRRDTGEEWYGSYSFAPIRDKSGHTVGSVLVGRDITERKKIENALRESEALFSTIFHASPFSISFTQEDSDVWEEVNEAFLAMTGYNKEEIIGKTYLDINLWKYPDRRAELRKILKQQGNVSNFEIEINKKDGTEGTVLLSIDKFELHNKPYLLFLANEITEKKRNENTLRRNADLLNDMGKVARIGGWEFDPETGEGSWTAEVAKIHDLEPDVPTSVAMGINFYTEVSRKIIDNAIKDLLSTGRSYDLELELVTAKGIHKWIRTIGHPVIENGKIVNVRGSFQDISEQKTAESILRLQSERLRVMHEIDHAILQAMESPENIALTALSYLKGILNYKNAMVGFFNPKTKEMNYFSPDETNPEEMVSRFTLTEEQYEGIEFLGRNSISIVSDIKDINIPSSVFNMLRQIGIFAFVNTPLFSAQAFYGTLNIGWGESREIDPGELEIIEEVSSQISLAIEQAYLLNESQRYTIELEERVKERTRQLQDSNKELEAFTYSVSHDLRAPLRHINGYIDLLISKYNENLPEKGKHYLDTIMDSATQMGTLIDDLLQFSRTGRQEMRKGNLDMNTMVEEVIQSFSAETAQRSIEWNIAELPAVFGDHSLLKMVWTNLISNAVKYTREKDKAIIEIMASENQDFYTFSVKDNGAGFDMNYAHKLFGVFQRLHTLQQFEGTGIGLANVRRIINKHGGTTWADAVPEQGATFYFTLPKIKETRK